LENSAVATGLEKEECEFVKSLWKTVCRFLKKVKVE